MENLFQGRKSVFAAMAIIVVLGAFLRLYHLTDWLHFELDQARDAKVVAAAAEGGIGELPLLGPRAGGTFLRLGPGFYYTEYIGSLVFGSNPGGLAVPVALLSVASIVVFYFFLRRYFETKIALCLTLLFSVSAFTVLYGRFSWNPNALPFFLMFGFYALLRSADVREPHKDRWFVGSACLLVYATHLHFLAFIALPVIIGVFLLIKRTQFSWETWCVVFAVIVLMYVPVILNETVTGGANTREFIQAVHGKSNKSQHSLTEKVVRNVTNQSLGYWVALTGYEESSMGQFTSKGAFDFELTCGDDCHAHLISALLALIIFLVVEHSSFGDCGRRYIRKRKTFFFFRYFGLGCVLRFLHRFPMILHRGFFF